MNLGKINRQSIGISGFTSVLKDYEGMPTSLFYIGTLPHHRPPTVAIIGSRKPTPYGEQVTHMLASELARRGVLIVSGLAYGVDSIAHKAALEVGGTTIAVLAGGLHTIYPAVHTGLAKDILALGGAVLSEQPLGTEAHKYHFLARNRLVSGLADAIIVTEATAKSGTFSTVAHALTQNKEVFAVPGPITSLLSAGPNRLVQEGAHVALCAQDILDIIAPKLPNEQGQLALGDTPEEECVLKLLRSGPVEFETIIGALSISVQQSLQLLTLMELKGLITSSGGTWHRRP